MPTRRIDWEAYQGMTRLLLLAVVLAVVLWWAVAVNGPHRPIAKPVPRTPPDPRPVKRVRSHAGSNRRAFDEVVVVENNSVPRAVITDDDDYWPDIIDA